jgi:hypothetical protein
MQQAQCDRCTKWISIIAGDEPLDQLGTACKDCIIEPPLTRWQRIKNWWLEALEL